MKTERALTGVSDHALQARRERTGLQSVAAPRLGMSLAGRPPVTPGRKTSPLRGLIWRSTANGPVLEFHMKPDFSMNTPYTRTPVDPCFLDCSGGVIHFLRSS